MIRCAHKQQIVGVNNANTYKGRPGIPAIIRETIRPVFISLSYEKLLSKCLYGSNSNENSF